MIRNFWRSELVILSFFCLNFNLVAQKNGWPNTKLRAGKEYAAHATVLTHNLGVTGGKYLNPRTLLEASIYSGTTHFFFGKALNLIEVNYKYFQQDTFYTNLGGTLRTLYSRVRPGNDDPVSEKTDLGFNFSLGNRWQWETFSMGCDWFGIYAPLVTLGSSGDYKSSSDNKISLNLYLLRFHLGASF